MKIFKFNVDEEANKYCILIANTMVELFGIEFSEAIERINNHWKGQQIIGDDIIYHEDNEYWANTIYYGHESNWWLPEKKEVLKPKEYRKI